jgi:nicotinate phosphoribosyltransferase
MVDCNRPVGLATDLYQLTMGASLAALNRNGPATFSLFVRGLPAGRSFLVATGLADALDRLQRLHFSDEDLEYLRTVSQIRSDFIDVLADFRFSGDVWAVPEGRLIFPDEPLLEVRAPFIEAQLAETVLINAFHFPTLVATKAAMCILAAPGKMLIDFGLRRTPSIDAGLAVARAAYLAGFASTSNVLAGKLYGIPVSGTVAHSFIESFPSELEAFRAFAQTFPGPVTLLIDSYDTVRGAELATAVGRELAAEGKSLLAVRLDSGDLDVLSRQVRQILDAAGLRQVRIVASGGLDEQQLAALTRTGAPIDIYGVGTRLGTSADAPTLDMAYKLVEYDGRPCLKLSPGKQTLAGAKQVWRRRDGGGGYTEDLLATRDEPAPGADWAPLLQPVMLGGKPLPQPTLAESRDLVRRELEALPPRLRSLDQTEPYPVHVSRRLGQVQEAARAFARNQAGLPPALTD